MAEYFSSGTTLQTGANIVGDQNDTGDVFEIRDTFYMRVGSGTWAQDLKFGGAWQYVRDDWDFPGVPEGPAHLRDRQQSASAALRRHDGIGPVEGDDAPDLGVHPGRPAAVAARDDQPRPALRPRHQRQQPRLHEPGDAHGARPGTRTTSSRGRASRGTSRATAATSCAAALGMFTGRFLLVPAHIELQQNGYTGRIIQQRINGALLGLPAFALDPNNPTTTGLPLTRDSSRIDDTFVNPYSTQATVGYSVPPRQHRPLRGLRGHLRQGRRRDHHPRQELAREHRDRVQRRRRGMPAEQGVQPDQRLHERGPVGVQGVRQQPERHAQGRAPRHGVLHGRRQEEHQRRLQPGADRLPERPGQHRGRVGTRARATSGTGSPRRP